MAKVIANDIKAGNIIEHRDSLWSVAKTEHTQPGKGGAYIQIEMKDILVGTKLNKRFRSGDKIERATVEEEEYQYLYSSGKLLVIMDTENYEQIEIQSSLLGEQVVFLKEEMLITIAKYKSKIIYARPPAQVVLAVKETEAVIKGQTASSSFKPAILENDIKIMVPPFIKPGDKIVVSTTDFTYIEKAKTAE
ncbi:elongation factor P [Rickettsiales bacterium]|nr:elongation factor P [Rickettsiales bacterium]